MATSYFSYWGKASPQTHDSARFHLLPFHCLDVAACGEVLIKLEPFSLKPLADELGWPLVKIETLFIFFLALHDLGKFARAFQGLVPDLSPDLVPADSSKRYEQRHDTLGWALWHRDVAMDCPSESLPVPDHEFWAVWVRCVVGHHGKPPQESEAGGLIALDVEDFFCRVDRHMAREFVADVSGLLELDGVPAPGREQMVVLRRHAWRLAGLAVLSDWLGSIRSFSPIVVHRHR